MEKTTKYVKVAYHEAEKGTFSKCLLLYSGGLDTSVMLKWIQEEYKCEVVALTIDIGQRVDDMVEIKQKAIKLGAKDAIVVDAKDMFADTVLAEAVKANADYQGGYTISCPLGRVMISKIAVEYAEKYGCEVVAHGCTGKGNDQVRFEGYITTLNPKLKIIAPVREWGMGRDEEIAYAAQHGIPVKQKKDSPYSYDENMWGNTGEGGEVEDPELIPPLERILQWCKPVEQTPNEPLLVTVEYVKGVPVGINGKKMKFSEIIRELNNVGSEHGVGVQLLIEDRVVGLKVRGVYEQPGSAILIAGHKRLEMLVSTREENELKSFIDNKWAYLTYGAKWFDPVMAHILSYIDSQNEKVTGTATLRLFKGKIDVVALKSDNSLFNASLATFQRDAKFNVNASAGFIEIYNLAQKTAYNTFPYSNKSK